MQTKVGYCIRCGTDIALNKGFPFCHTCGCTCNAGERFSASENLEMFCHGCGEAVYVSHENPFCSLCLDLMEKKMEKKKSLIQHKKK